MVGMQSPLIFFGNERLATGLTDTAPVTFQRLIERYEVAAVVTPFKASRSRKARPLEIEVAARTAGVPVINPPNKEALLPLLQPFGARLGVLAAFGMIVPPEVIASFEYGIINVHPSLLPRYRGSTPIEQAILDGADETGVSIMQLDQGMDTGPVLAQQTVRLTGTESKAEVARRLQELGAKLVMQQVAAVTDGTVHPTPQNPEQATYCTPLTKADGLIDWQKPAVRLEREVRAYLGWPGSRTTLLGREVTLTQARVATEAPATTAQLGDHTVSGEEIWVRTGDGTLAIQRLKPAGKHEMAAGDFARGQRPE